MKKSNYRTNIEKNRSYVRINDSSTSTEFLTDPVELEAARSEIVSFIGGAVRDADADGAVVAMSGGIDSTLTATLAVEALGSDRVLGLSLPATKLNGQRANEARTIADGLGIAFRDVQLKPLLDAFEDTAAREIEPSGGKREIGNVLARLRMVCAYYAANAHHRLVLGTGNRSERLLGYFTKYGDGAADLSPIGDLYKVEVRAVAQHVGVPRRIISKESTAGLWSGQTDEGDLGASYEVIDQILTRVVDRGERTEDVARAVDADTETVEHVTSLYRETRHKRTTPPTPRIHGRTS